MTPDHTPPEPNSPGLSLAPTAFAIGMVGLLVVFPAEMAGANVGRAGIAAGLLVFGLGATLGRTHAPGRAVGWFLASVVGLSAVAIGLWRTSDRLWLGALGLALAGATLAYGLHRYERVRLGLVEAGPEGET